MNKAMITGKQVLLTGGGSGMPFTSELPNGWTVRFSASPHFSVDMEQIEWGIEPDIKVDMDKADEANHIDTFIEREIFRPLSLTFER